MMNGHFRFMIIAVFVMLLFTFEVGWEKYSVNVLLVFSIIAGEFPVWWFGCYWDADMH
jgi:hypothetical protein